MTLASDEVARVDAVRARFAALTSGSSTTALTDPDPASGERWEEGQVWAHVAEFVPYWVEEARRVVAGGSVEACPFGRTKSDPARLTAIERDRRTDREALWQRVDAGIGELGRFLNDLEESNWEARGVHPTLGVMSLQRLLNEFLVGHLEEHADQLEALSRASRN